MRVIRDFMNRKVEVIEVCNSKAFNNRQRQAYCKELEAVLAAPAEKKNPEILKIMHPGFMAEKRRQSAIEKGRRIAEARKVEAARRHIHVQPEEQWFVVPDSELPFLKKDKIHEAVNNHVNIPKERGIKKEDKNVLTYNAILRHIVSDSGRINETDAEELCRLIYGIPFEHGEGYSYKADLFTKFKNEYVVDFENGLRILNKSNIPRRFVEYKRSYDGYFIPVLPEKCRACQLVNVHGITNGQKNGFGQLIVKPRFTCSCDSIIDAPRHDCMPDISGQYVIPVENTAANSAEKHKGKKAAWIQKIFSVGYAEAAAIDEDLEIIAPGNKSAKMAVMSSMSSIEICFMAFELKRLEPSRELKTETYSEIYMDEDEQAIEDLLAWDVDVMTEEITVETGDRKTYGVNSFNYIKPHYNTSLIKIRGLFDKCKTAQEMIDVAKNYDWSDINWDEYHTLKQELIDAAKRKMQKIIEWVKNNKVEAKKRLVAITYRGEQPATPLNSDELNLLWKALKQ